MLNKVRIIGNFLPIKKKVKKEEERTKKFLTYFNLKVINPSNAFTVLRCATHKEAIKKIIEQEVNEEEVVEIRGYLRNDIKNSIKSRQIIVRVIYFNKLDIKSNDINKKDANQVRLIGEISDLQEIQKKNNNNINSLLLSFRVFVPRGKVIIAKESKEEKDKKRDLFNFFCRIQGRLTSDTKTQLMQLKNKDVVFLEGFLQTIRRGGARNEEPKFRLNEENENHLLLDDSPEKDWISTRLQNLWISSIICSKLICLDSDSVDTFYSLDKLIHINIPIEEINFEEKNEEKNKKE